MDPLIWAVLALALVSVALVALIESLVRSSARERELLAAERRELADRIQAPERLPYRPAEDLVAIPEREPDDLHTVGSISIDPDWLTSDED